MFGYVIPYDKNLAPEAKQQYRADYCGLCRCLGKRYGFAARFLVSYDMTFLYALLAAGAELEGEKPCFCPANPFCRKKCRKQEKNMEFCADATMVLSDWRLRDTVQDSKGLKKWGAALLRWCFGRKFRRAARRLPEFSHLVEVQMDKLHQLEREKSPSLDRTADTFAVLLQGCALGAADPVTQRILRQLLYHTGRYLYLVDALDDLQKDLQHDQYNPLRYRFSLADGKLLAQDQKDFLESVDYSIGLAASALELLDRRSHRALLENIIYYGMPSVMKSVAAGVFRKRRKQE